MGFALCWASARPWASLELAGYAMGNDRCAMRHAPGQCARGSRYTQCEVTLTSHSKISSFFSVMLSIGI